MATYTFPDINILVDAAVSVDRIWQVGGGRPSRDSLLRALAESGDHKLSDLGGSLSQGAVVTDDHMLASVERTLVKRGWDSAKAEAWARKIWRPMMLVRPLDLRIPAGKSWDQLSEDERERIWQAASRADWSSVKSEADEVTLPAMYAANELPLIAGLEGTQGAIVADMLPNGSAEAGDKRADIEDARMITRHARAASWLKARGLVEHTWEVSLMTSDKAAAVAIEAIQQAHAACYQMPDGAIRSNRMDMEDVRKLVAATHVKRGTMRVNTGRRQGRGAGYSVGSY